MNKPRVLFFNINGSGLGHMNRCLAYARRLDKRADAVFFSLASAIEIIHEMGFEADYFVSDFWSRSPPGAWNRELAFRFGMMLERVRPDVVVFDGTWPFKGFLHACRAYGVPKMVWSNRGLHKEDMPPVPVDESLFDLVIEPGELGAQRQVTPLSGGGVRLLVPPVSLLTEDELLDRASARDALGLDADGRYVLFSLGPGNLKDVSELGRSLISSFQDRAYKAVWARAPISVRDTPFPDDVLPVSVYPMVRYLRAFDAFVGAAGYNTCCEVVQARVPTLLVPNTQLVDDQARRARMVSEHAPAVVSACESATERERALAALDALREEPGAVYPAMDGASQAAEAILALAGGEAIR